VGIISPSLEEVTMSRTVRLLLTVSRPEFIPANSASLIIGLSWGIKLPVEIVWGLLIPVVLVYATISLVAAVAAQINTMADYELDQTDSRKKELVEAMKSVGYNKVKTLVVIELLLSLTLIILLWQFQGKPLLLLMWTTAVFLAYAYSSPPLRLKSRSLLAVLTLIIVLSILPVSFVYHAFTFEVDPLFFLFLSGQALTVYGVIVPAEIRDYFRDKLMGVQTMTVQLGLVKASIFSILLLSMGGILAGTGLSLKLLYSSQPMLIVFVAVMAVVYCFILRKYLRLYSLSKIYVASENSAPVAQEIEILSAENPKWITIITQIIVFMCVVLLVSKIFS
jgi:4-hydroxybenzoate polyprenyltransferase